MNEDNGARLEKIQGGVDLINERLNSFNQLANERHHATQSEIAALKVADEKLDGRVGVLESESSERVGQLKGIALSGRILWTLIGAVPVAIGAAIMKLFT